MKLLMLTLGLCLTTNVAYKAANASPLPAVGNGPYALFAKMPDSGSPAPRYHAALLSGAKPEPTTGTMVMRAVGRGNVPPLVQKPLVRRWHLYLPTPPGLRKYHLPPLSSYNFVNPLAINQHHTLVGYYGGGGSGAYLVILAKAFLWQKGRLHLLPTLPEYTITHAVAINDHGLIVGDSGNGPADYYHDPHALLWTRGYRYDLNTLISPRSGWVLSTATGINDKGQITGQGLFHGKEKAFLLTPQTER